VKKSLQKAVGLIQKRSFGTGSTNTSVLCGLSLLSDAAGYVVRLSYMNYANATSDPVQSFVSGHTIANEREFLRYANMFKQCRLDWVQWTWEPETTAKTTQMFYRSSADTVKCQNLELHMRFPIDPGQWDSSLGYVNQTNFEEKMNVTGLPVEAYDFWQDKRVIKKSMNKRWTLRWKAKTMRTTNDLNVYGSTLTKLQTVNRGYKWVPTRWENVIEPSTVYNTWDPLVTTTSPNQGRSALWQSVPINEPYAAIFDKNTQTYIGTGAALSLEVTGKWILTSHWSFRGKPSEVREILTNVDSSGFTSFVSTTQFRGGIDGS